MSGFGQLWVPPSFATGPPATKLKGGYPDGTQVASGLASPADLTSLSPPTLLELYEIYSLAVGWGVQFVNNTLTGTQIAATLQLLINDRPAYTLLQSQVVATAIAYGTFSADLINPIRVGARDRLGLAISVASVVNYDVMIGATPAGGTIGAASNWTLAESTISYNVLDLPASRQL